jgi:hypothetical protein
LLQEGKPYEKEKLFTVSKISKEKDFEIALQRLSFEGKVKIIDDKVMKNATISM